MRTWLVRPTAWDGHHHPALRRFPPWEGEGDGRYVHNFLGVRTDPKFRVQYNADPPGPVTTVYPSPSYEYFEWVFVLDTVLCAPDERPLVVAELGAGYGHWLACVFKALEGLGKPSPDLIGVEMEPARFQWMTEHLTNNGIDPAAHRLVHAAISDYDGSTSLPTATKSDEEYGLSMLRRREPHTRSGHERVSCVSLGTLLESAPVVDLMHVDIQGEELRALASASATIGNAVRRLYVATHSRSIHRRTRSLLNGLGWREVFCFGPRSYPKTEFGHVRMLDGVLAFENPHLWPARDPEPS
jgi:FkbM family methyltransferase